MTRNTRNFLIFAGLGFVGYMLFKRMGVNAAAQAAQAAKAGAAAASRFVPASAQPVDQVVSEYGLNGRVVSEQ